MEKRMIVYIGTYTEPILFGTGKVLQGKGDGIYLRLFDPATGELSGSGPVFEAVNPSYLCLAPDSRFLYAVNELKTFRGEPGGGVSSFSVDPESGSLSLVNQQPTGGTDPCFVETDRSGKHVFVANFASGSVSVYPVRPDGGLDGASDFIQHEGSSVDPVRQRGPHAHSVVFDPEERFAFVPDLGLDRLVAYRFDPERGTLRERAELSLRSKPGAGPRHLAFHPDGKYAYLINELDSTMSALSWNAADAAMKELQVVPTLPEGYGGQSSCADIRVDPTGSFLYGSNRGHDSIVGFRIDRETGRLEYIGHTASGGGTPRVFSIDPSGSFLLAANQDSDTILSFRIDRQTGALEPTGHVAEVPTPVCIQFAPGIGS